MKPRPLSASATASLAAILILAAGCGAENPAAPQLEPATMAAAWGGVGGHVSVLRRAHHAGRFSNRIGPEGGTIDFGIGSLTIPVGALHSAVQITAMVNGKDLSVDFQPHGLTFPLGKQPILSFAVEGMENDLPQILYLDETGSVVERLSTYRDSIHGTPSARLNHFSAYALAGS